MKSIYKVGFFIGRCIAVSCSFPVRVFISIQAVAFLALDSFVEGLQEAITLDSEERKLLYKFMDFCAFLTILGIISIPIVGIYLGTAEVEKIRRQELPVVDRIHLEVKDAVAEVKGR